MPAFFLSLLACAVAVIAGREAVRVARLADALGARAGLFAAVAVASIASSAIAAWLGSLLAPSLDPAAKLVFLAIALLLAGVELALRRAPPKPREPTYSTGAILLVLFAGQLTDGARFLVLAFAAALGAPVLAGAGGALGGLLTLAGAALAGGVWERLPLGLIRWSATMLFVLSAAMVAIAALGLSN